MTDTLGASAAIDEADVGRRLGARIRELRQSRGLTLVRLAAAPEPER